MSKKILIITFPLYTNYGGILQAYALQKVLKDKGFDAYTDLRWPLNPSKKISYVSFFYRIFKKYILRKDIGNIKFPYFLNERGRVIISEHTRSFVYRNMKTVELFEKNGLASDSLTLDAFDYVVVGSDQVWRPNKQGVRPFYLLDFLNERSVPRLAYAVSFGIDPAKLSCQCPRETNTLVEKFDFISVREKSGIDMCKLLFNKTAQHVLDPTMLLDVMTYKKIIGLGNINRTDSIFAYILDRNKEKQDIVNLVSLMTQLCIADNHELEDLCWTDRFNLNSKKVKSVESWLAGIYNSSFVVTDSFHGCVFSILFNKPFIAILNDKRGSARFDSLLNLFNLSGRLVTSSTQLSDIISQDIDWHSVNTILESERYKSNCFIDKFLSI